MQAKVSEGTAVNLQSYVETEFATFDEKPFNELDAALFTQLAMVRVELAAFVQGAYKLREDGVLVDASGSDELVFSLRDLLCAECFDQMFTGLVADQVRACFLAAAMNPRYRAVRVVRYQSVFDADRAAQFSATTFACDEFVFVAFRGPMRRLSGGARTSIWRLKAPFHRRCWGWLLQRSSLSGKRSGFVGTGAWLRGLRHRWHGMSGRESVRCHGRGLLLV